MYELFLNPANMALGGLLISSPIIIHLINRMRFKRVRWAAMEFLLKSQKRNRRRLIIEQLILLLLRILLVLLAGLLLARFLGLSYAGFLQPQNTTHVVILDDRLSMTDRWKGDDGGDRKTCFLVGKDVVENDIAKNVVRARSPQRFVLLRLSQPGQPLFDQRLTEDTLGELRIALNQVNEATAEHLDMVKGVQAAEVVFDQTRED